MVGLVNAMAEHGHDAIAYLNDPLPGDHFPLHFVNNLDWECRDEDTRLKLLRAAMRGWKERAFGSPGPEEQFAGPAFTALFGRHWSLLPREEARSVLLDLYQSALDVKAEPHRFALTDNPADPDLNSETELRLFQLMPALHSLEPELVQKILKDHPQLAAVATRFPMGMQSVKKGVASSIPPAMTP
jgi:hypothetical protein